MTTTTSTLKGKDLVNMSQSEIDDLYNKGSVNKIPDGDSTGIAIIWAGSIFTKIIAFLSWLLFWKGKYFYKEEGYFLNKILPFGIRAVKGEIYIEKETCFFCRGKAIVLDYSKTTLLLRAVREEMREIAPGLFLAQVYWNEKRISNFTLEFEHSET